MRRFFSDDKQLNCRLIAVLVEGLLVIVALFVFCSMAFGWFAKNNQMSTGNMRVGAGGAGFPEMHAWRYDMDATLGTGEGNIDEDGDAFDKTGTWVDALDSTTTTNPKGILPNEIYTGNAHTSQYLFRSLHLGTVENLLTLSNDNCFYIRFDVIGAVCSPSSISYSLTSSGIKIYDQEGSDVTTTIASLNELEDFVSVFTADAAVSTTAYVPSTDQEDIDALFYTNNERTGLLTNGAAPVRLADGSEEYYIYLRFSPDLAMCFDATDGIAAYMPCEVTFDVTLTVDFS